MQAKIFFQYNLEFYNFKPNFRGFGVCTCHSCHPPGYGHSDKCPPQAKKNFQYNLKLNFIISSKISEVLECARATRATPWLWPCLQCLKGLTNQNLKTFFYSIMPY